jgi:predicted RNA binding protein YcfA (HicA-like mRNA interferase family)
MGMPRKIRQLKADLRKAGFVEDSQRGKGSHSWWYHPRFPEAIVTLSGNDGVDAQKYHERHVRQAIALVQRAEKPSN